MRDIASFRKNRYSHSGRTEEDTANTKNKPAGSAGGASEALTWETGAQSRDLDAMLKKGERALPLRHLHARERAPRSLL